MDANTIAPEAVTELLQRAGVPQAKSLLVWDVDEVAGAFNDLGASQAVLKAAGLLHKTEAGAVHVDIDSAEAARAAARDLYARIGEAGLPFLVQEKATGLELLVGLRGDPRLGTAVVAGLGGIYTEIHRDVVRRLVPVTMAQARAMLQELRSWPLLDGYRGSVRPDVDAFCDLIVKVAALGAQEPSISELDLNPVMVGAEGQGCVVVDARAVSTSAAPLHDRPAPDLRRMLRPEHIAVVGVSDDETKVGAKLFRYLVSHGFPGRLDPVHPNGGTVRGHTRYESLTALPSSPDLVCVTVPATAVPDVAQEAVAVEAGGVLVHSSDFAEVGAEGQALQDQVRGILASAGIPLAGPNNMGIVAPGSGLAASISGGLEMDSLTAGRVGLLTSSGALGSCLATRLMDTGVGLSCWVHVGNEANLVLADFLSWLAEDPGTGLAGMLIEDIKEGDRFVRAGQRMAAAGKPMFAYNMARSGRGREAALSHTGTMIGSFELREDVIRAAGMVSVPSLRVLEDALLLSARYDVPRGTRLVAITFSGGACAIIADEADRSGVQLPQLAAATAEQVRQHVPSYAAVRNPMDASYQMLSEPESLQRAIDALLANDEFDAALVQLTTNADPFAERCAEAVVSVQSRTNVPLYVSRFGSKRLAPKALRVYQQAGIPVLDAPDRATQAIAAVMRARAAIEEHRHV